MMCIRDSANIKLLQYKNDPSFSYRTKLAIHSLPENGLGVVKQKEEQHSKPYIL